MISLLGNVHLFDGLSTIELKTVADICSERTAAAGEIILEQGSEGSEVYIVADGQIEVFVEHGDQERPLVLLMKGQLFGEMSLVNHGLRSASGRAGSDGCRLLMFDANDFNRLAEQHSQIGYKVMRNLAHDLSFKIRHQNMINL